MLENLKKHRFSWTIALLMVAAFGLVGGTSGAFKQCIDRSYQESSDYQPPKGATQIFSTLGWIQTCYGEFLKEDGEAITAFFTLILALFTWRLWRSTEKLWDVTNRTLIGVERPVLFVTMPEVNISVPKGILDEGKPTFAIVAENVGKQMATIISGNANYVLQKSGTVPPLTTLTKPDSSFCHVRIIGERPILRDKSFLIVAQRLNNFTPEEVRGMNDETLFGFFRITLVYSDPVGTLRASTFIFARMWSFNPTEKGFVQVLSVDDVVDKKSKKKQIEAQRKLVSSLLELYREIDRPKPEPPPAAGT